MSRAVIVASGEMHDYTYFGGLIEPTDTVICADGGIRHLIAMGRKPDILFGDFDSCDFDEISAHPLMYGVPVVRFDRMKDKTDTELAVDYALEQGFSELVLLGVTGTRLDQTLISIFLLKTICARGARGTVIDEHNRMQMVTDTAEFARADGWRLSLIALTPQVEGITTAGLLYPLDDFTLPFGSTRGISNEFADDTAQVRISSGLLLAVMSRD